MALGQRYRWLQDGGQVNAYQAHMKSRVEALARQLDRLMSGGDPDSKLGMELHLEFHVKFALLSGSSRLA